MQAIHPKRWHAYREAKANEVANRSKENQMKNESKSKSNAVKIQPTDNENALKVRCPSCHAAPAYRCETLNGTQARTHKSRQEFYDINQAAKVAAVDQTKKSNTIEEDEPPLVVASEVDSILAHVAKLLDRAEDAVSILAEALIPVRINLSNLKTDEDEDSSPDSGGVPIIVKREIASPIECTLHEFSDRLTRVILEVQNLKNTLAV